MIEKRRVVPHWTAATVSSAIRKIYDLGDLAARPILLRLVVETIPAFMVYDDGTYGYANADEAQLRFSTITPASLYFAYIEQELVREYAKLETLPRISKGERRRFLVHLAQRMAERNAVSLTNAELTHEVKAFFRLTREHADSYTTDIRACSFLAPCGVGDHVQFVHKSFLEYFAAESFAPVLKDPSELERRLRSNTPSTEIMYFLGAYISAFVPEAIGTCKGLLRTSKNDVVVTALLNILSFARAPETCVRNLRVLSLLLSNIDVSRLLVEQSQVDSLRLGRSRVDVMALKESSFDTLQLADVVACDPRTDSLRDPVCLLMTECTVGTLHATNTSIRIHATKWSTDRLRIESAGLCLLVAKQSRLHIDYLEATTSLAMDLRDSVVSTSEGTVMARCAGDLFVSVTGCTLLNVRIGSVSGSTCDSVFIACHLEDPKALEGLQGCRGYFIANRDKPARGLKPNWPSVYSVDYVGELKQRANTGASEIEKLDVNERLAVVFPTVGTELAKLTRIQTKERCNLAQGDSQALARWLENERDRAG